MQIINSRNLILTLVIMFLASCATGSAIVTGTKRIPLEPSQVKLYLESPDKYEIIGLVNASSDAGWSAQGSIDYAIKELKNQAARIGANGVLLESTGERTSTIIGGYGTGSLYAIPVTAKAVSGKAIFVSE